MSSSVNKGGSVLDLSGCTIEGSFEIREGEGGELHNLRSLRSKLDVLGALKIAQVTTLLRRASAQQPELRNKFHTRYEFSV